MTISPYFPLLEGVIEAVWLVDPLTLNILYCNSAAESLVEQASNEICGQQIIKYAVTPEDLVFWEDIAAGIKEYLYSESFIQNRDGVVIPVERRVSYVVLNSETYVYMVVARDLREQRHVEDELERVVTELRATLESTADGIMVCDLHGQIRNYNKHFTEVWGGNPIELIPQHTSFIEHMEQSVVDLEAYTSKLHILMQMPLMEATDIISLKSGRVLERVTRPQYSRDNAIGRVYSFRDITQRVETHAKLGLAAKVFDSSMDAVFITDAHFKILAVNPAGESLTNIEATQLVGLTVQSLWDDSKNEAFMTNVDEELFKSGFWCGQIFIKQATKSEVCAVHLSWVLLKDSHGNIINTICFLRDLTDEIEAQQKIEQLSYRDSLTGVPNRLLLEKRVNFALRLAERHDHQFGIIYLNIDRFKNINDSLGHAFGNAVLIEFSERVKKCLRAVDTLSRIAGDEFVIFAHETNALSAENLAKRILESLEPSFHIDQMQLSVGCSIGIALYPDDSSDIHGLIKCAEAAMAMAKDRGRGNFRFYQPQRNVDLLSRMKVEHAMKIAIDQKLFKIHYQPQISLENGSLLAAEALIRWTDPTFGYVAPDMFIPLAEESGAILKIGAWVLEEVIHQAALWERQGRPLLVSINVSALQFQQADFVYIVKKLIHESGVSPHLIELELTESVLVKHIEDTLERLKALSKIGVGLSIDDFGTGYSSLAYLKKFPISKLKIDRSFVTGLPNDESDRAIVSATIGMAKGLKLKVVAEGVETEAQRKYLADLQCESYQGFLCSRGLPLSEFEILVSKLPKKH